MGRLPVRDDFPKDVRVSIVSPPTGDAPTNVLVLLHGLGDTHESFARLGAQMQLAETVCVALGGPQQLLDLDGRHWGDDILFDSNTGGLDADAGFKGTTKVLTDLVRDVLIARCGYRSCEVLFFGFGQGGMAALQLAVSLHQSAPASSADDQVKSSGELGGVISIGAGLPADAPASFDPKSATPVLVCAGSDQSAVTPSTEEKLRHIFTTVEVKRYRRPGDSMPSNRDEMLPIMQFFSRRLRSVKGVPAGSVEIS